MVLGDTFLTYHLPQNGEVTVPYLNQHLHTNMLILRDLITGSRGTATHNIGGVTSIPGATTDWQVIATIAAGELNTDLYFKWTADMAAAGGDVQCDIGWRLFGSDTVRPIYNNLTAAQSVAWQRLLHSDLPNQGIIEIVANNTSTEARTQEEQWSTDWNARYRWEWSETYTEEYTVRTPRQERYQSGTRTVRTPYQVEVCRDVREQVGTLHCYRWAIAEISGRICNRSQATARLVAQGQIDSARAARPGAPANIVYLGTVGRYETRRVCHNETRYRETQEPVYSSRTVYDEETRTRTRTRTRTTSWTTVRSGTANAATEVLSRAAANTAANAVQVSTTGRPNSRARANIQRNVGTPRNTQKEQIQPAGTVTFSNQVFETRIFIGSSEAAP